MCYAIQLDAFYLRNTRHINQLVLLRFMAGRKANVLNAKSCLCSRLCMDAFWYIKVVSEYYCFNIS